MSRRQVAPLLVAGLTGILSGIYIFKPLLESEAKSLDAQSSIGIKNDRSTEKNAPDLTVSEPQTHAAITSAKGRSASSDGANRVAD
ncbi:uncharacterized protein LAESUDRAFT_45531 [Laetiporus sulphureus 93-53]|uniref:Uncharacterized protein n=1 Tax=Laetiporus sulphureus 93-53 TaxID=1314785 RepID=A0A165F962_9APHY|nr:uncharacterized protein LAESUDRAFT_45531 [Laetiporus sulphureus 93-53]KZT08622.1 hypothetical protein LAESUDRAFT_45531 [Laetiporus sulphureus 93-53]